MPDIENSRETTEKGAEGVTAKQPKHPKKKKKNSCFARFGCFPAALRLFYRHFAGDPLGTFFGLFSGCFQCQAFGTFVDGNTDCNRNREVPPP